MGLPELNDVDYVVLADLIKQYPREFYTDMTNFYIRQMYQYIDEGRIFRSSVMGPTRGGKSEMVSSLSFIYIKRFNLNIKNNTYTKNNTVKTIFEQDGIKLQKLRFDVSFVYGSVQEYNDKQKERAKNGEILFGQVHQIDEDRRAIGGLGSMSAHIESSNINNISAKFMQSEFYITPDYMITKNAPYGIRVYKKDINKRTNYGLLYKIEMNNSGGADFKFIGWVDIPLHPFEDFRIEYNRLKDSWIMGEISGKANARDVSRYNVAETLSKSDIFKMNDKQTKFIYTKQERLSYLDQLILKGEVSNFNELEKIRIVEQATLLVKQKRF